VSRRRGIQAKSVYTTTVLVLLETFSETLSHLYVFLNAVTRFLVEQLSLPLSRSLGVSSSTSLVELERTLSDATS
jgi:hypothetical protein